VEAVIDWDDVSFTALVWPVGGFVLGVVGIVVVCLLATVAWQNEQDCLGRRCQTPAHAQLFRGECFCVSDAGVSMEPAP
jgi:hypothetical protein